MIRKIRNTEIDKLIALYTHLNVNDTLLPSKDIIKKVWNEIINNDAINYFVFEKDDEIIATCHLVIVPNLTRSCRPYGIIENVVTNPNFRSKGIGKEILKYAIKYAWAKNCYKVMLLTGSKKEWVHKFYKNAGFTKGIKEGFIAYPT